MYPPRSIVPAQRSAPDEGWRLGGPAIACYRDPLSDCNFVIATPAMRRDLWVSYLAGAVRSYRHHGVESVLEYDQVVDGESTSVFFAAVDRNGSVVGGMRVQGPYSMAAQAHAVSEWDGRAGSAELHCNITARLADGVIEMKTGWVDDIFTRRRELTAALARIFVHSIELMGVRYALGTVAEHAVRRWQTTGGVVDTAVEPVAYPDVRYRTVPMWWDRDSYSRRAVPEQLPQIQAERIQIVASSVRIVPARAGLSV